jgi:ATP-dependent exoDNAse (exonuclease V) alpha subunit
MTWWGEKYNVETLKRNVLAPEVLELKKDAEVMFVANNFDKGYVNGSRGKVVKFNEDGQPVVKLQSNGQHITVEIKKWNIEEGEDVIAQVKQLPLRLAWAITIHKSQGMTLDGAEIDLTRAFTPGMGYVALSRVKSFDQLYLKGMNEMAMKLNDEIFAFDAEMRERSEVK